MRVDSVSKKIKLKNIDKAEWQKFRFDEIAYNINERVEPLDTDLEIYVGLEHLDPESIHIKRFGKREDVKGTKLRVRPGDVIFGRRRAYQRKAALAEFDGFCSAHAMVLRANPDVIDPNLFPFFLHSDTFMHKAIDISVGSLSPTINWGTMKKQEFLLPPKEQQAQLAELLWAMNEVVEREFILKEKLEIGLDASIENEIHGLSIKNKTIKEVIAELAEEANVVSLGSLGDFYKGKGISKADVVENGYPCVRYGELYTRHFRIIRKFHSFIDQNLANRSSQLKTNDVVFAGSGETITEIGQSAAFTGDEIAFAGSDTIIFRPHEMDGGYLGYLMNSQLVRQQLNKYGTGATVMHIYPSELRKIKIPLIDFEKQEKIGMKLESLAKTIALVDSKINDSKALQKSLINQIF